MLIETKYPHVEGMDELVPLAFQILRFKMNDFRSKSPAARRVQPGLGRRYTAHRHLSRSLRGLPPPPVA